MYYEELLNEERCEQLVYVLNAYYGSEPWTDEEEWYDTNVVDAYDIFKDEYSAAYGRQRDKYADKAAADAVMEVLPRDSREFKGILRSVSEDYDNRNLVKPWMKEFVLD